MHSLQNEYERLINEWRLVNHQWSETCAHWQDSSRAAFDQKFWQEFKVMTNAYLREMEETIKVLNETSKELNMNRKLF